jgi:Rho-type GTPase-activating protein 1/2
VLIALGTRYLRRAKRSNLVSLPLTIYTHLAIARGLYRALDVAFVEVLLPRHDTDKLSSQHITYLKMDVTNIQPIAGNRWHLNCFRCNTCGTLLDSDANLLLLGDGSLICNNCTYSCSACGNKIEDLAILTGDQAFCATCFRCRNCKRKIENLRYARTSQGIFCMSCHESLMARRRKKSKAAAQAKAREKEGSPMVVDKSLPALPPNAIPNGAFSNDRVEPESDHTPTELSPRPRQYPRNDETSSRGSSRQNRSPERPSLDRSKDSGLSLPQTTYRNNRNSAIFSSGDNVDNGGGNEQDFFIPVALDPSPLPAATPRSASDHQSADLRKPKERDYFSIPQSGSTTERKAEQQTTPHIAFQAPTQAQAPAQEKNRSTSSEYESSPGKGSGRRLSKSKPPTAAADDRVARMPTGKSQVNEDFKLQDAPKSKKTGPRNSSSQSNGLSEDGSKGQVTGKDKESTPGASRNGSPQLLQAADRTANPRTSQDSRARDDDDVLSNDSSQPSLHPPKPIARKELPSSVKADNQSASRREASSVNELSADDRSDINVKPPTSQQGTAPRPSGDLSSSADRASFENKPSNAYMAPRAPPAAPTHTAGKESISSAAENLEEKTSPKLPRWSSGGDFSMEEDIARILNTDEGSSNILRRVSNAVRHSRTTSAEQGGNPARMSHTRSVSESTRATMSPHWSKGAIPEDPTGANGLTSPTSASSSDNTAQLKQRLRNSEQRVAELERQFTNEKDLKNVRQALEEKRKTVAVLDSQTEIMIRELEVLAGFVEKAKASKRPIDTRELEESAIKEFVQKLDKLKHSMEGSLEELYAARDKAIEEKEHAMADRDRALMEFEQLSSKNAQLADMNNDLTHQIQEKFKHNSDMRSPMSGLGIYNHHKGPSNLDASSIQTGSTLIPDQEEPIVESGPTVVNIRKGKVQKFSWKKGGKAVAQNIAKGVNRTVGALQQPERRDQPGLVGENIGLPYNMTHAPVESPVMQQPNGQLRQPQDPGRQGFFGFKKSSTMPRGLAAGNSSTPVLAEAANVLFGSDLSERADYERRQIPCIVTRCIEEVELRGMDMEGIYRKTGGNSQVKMLQEGFEKNENFDISDSDIDITAVTSALKQYFRKLPLPLLTYDVYDRVLETNCEYSRLIGPNSFPHLLTI